jgi:hypothetical protein
MGGGDFVNMDKNTEGVAYSDPLSIFAIFSKIITKKP